VDAISFAFALQRRQQTGPMSSADTTERLYTIEELVPRRGRRFGGLLPVNELTMNLTSERVDYRYFKVLIVGEAVITKMLRKLFAVLDSLQVAFKVDPDPISERDAIFHIEKEFLHFLTSDTNPACQESFRM
jgi:hypothetical protein